MKSAILMFTFLIAPLVAQAEIESTYTDWSHFGAYVLGMPDLDQRRDTANWSVDRNEGRMYCGPTAGANVLSYLAGEGYSGVSAPTTDLKPVDTDDLTGRELLRATLQNMSRATVGDYLIANVADEMGTHPIDGTGASDMRNGLLAMLSSDYDVTLYGGTECSSDSNYTISPRKIFNELEDGHLVIVRFGYYTPLSDGCVDRVGGHWVAVNGVVRSDGVRRLWWRDSARDADVSGSDHTTQSVFVTDTSALEKASVHTPSCTRTRWQVVDRAGTGSDPDRHSYIEDMIVIAPPST